MFFRKILIYGGLLNVAIVPKPRSYLHCNENPIYLFLFWELRGLSPNFHIHVSVSDLNIPRIGPHSTYFQQLKRQIDRGNI
jgi:hypothetical protein